MADITTRYLLTGDSSSVVAAMERAGVTSAQLQGQMGGLTSAMNRITGAAGVVAGVLAGGAMFKAAVGETVKWTGEAVKLSRALGITTERASVLNLALGDVYLSHEDMIAGSSRLTRTLNTNEAAFQRLGVQTRDTDGHFRNTLDIMVDVNDKLRGMKEGTDRNIAGIQLYGKGWQEASGLLKLTTQVMEDARKKADDLHLIVGPEAVNRMKGYKAAMNDVEDVWMAAKVLVGEQLLPVLTSVGIWFSDMGPTALLIFGGALKGVMTFLEYLGLGLQTSWEFLKMFVADFNVGAQTVAGVVGSLMTGDFKNAVNWGKWGWGEFNKAGATAYDNIAAAAEKTNDRVGRLWGLRATVARPDHPQAGGGNNFDGAGKAAGGSAGSAKEIDTYSIAFKTAKDDFGGVLTQVLKMQEEAKAAYMDDAMSRRYWADRNMEASTEVLAAEQDFYSMRSALRGDDSFQQLAAIDAEEQRWIQSWAMQTSSFEEFERRKSIISQTYDEKRRSLTQSGSADLLRWERATGAERVGIVAHDGIRMTQAAANSNRALFMANKAFRLVEAGMELKAGIVKTWNSYPYPWNIPMTALHAAAGVVQLQDLASAGYGSSGGSATPGGGYGGGTPASPIVTQPLAQGDARPSIRVEVNIAGSVTTQDELARDLAPILTKVWKDNVH